MKITRKQIEHRRTYVVPVIDVTEFEIENVLAGSGPDYGVKDEETEEEDLNQAKKNVSLFGLSSSDEELLQNGSDIKW